MTLSYISSVVDSSGVLSAPRAAFAISMSILPPPQASVSSTRRWMSCMLPASALMAMALSDPIFSTSSSAGADREE